MKWCVTSITVVSCDPGHGEDMFGISLAGGAEIFAAFIVFMLVAFSQATYSKSGSGFSRHPYFRRTTDCPGARAGDQVSGREGIARMTSRGTR